MIGIHNGSDSDSKANIVMGQKSLFGKVQFPGITCNMHSYHCVRDKKDALL